MAKNKSKPKVIETPTVTAQVLESVRLIIEVDVIPRDDNLYNPFYNHDALQELNDAIEDRCLASLIDKFEYSVKSIKAKPNQTTVTIGEYNA